MLNRVRCYVYPNTNRLFTPKCLPPRLLSILTLWRGLTYHRV
nr:MAG TPA: hypothetical protein [Caudoviricetes sp.]